MYLIKAFTWLLLTRQSADTYVAAGYSQPIKTAGCTISARLMRGYIDNSRHKPFLVFIDNNGEEEGRCQLKDKKRP